MELTDVIIYLVYAAIVVALGAVVWSMVQQRRHTAGQRLMPQSSRRRMLSSAVWIYLGLWLVGAAIASKGSVVSVVLITMVAMLLTAVVAVCVSMMRRR